MMTLQHQTRIAVQFVVDDNTGRIVQFITAITALIQLLISFGQFITNAALLICDIIEAVNFTAKVWSIWFNAFNFGLFGAGVKV